MSVQLRPAALLLIFLSKINKAIIYFKNGAIEVDIADSMLQRAIGLSFRQSLEQNKGMYFYLFHQFNPVFWNFGMYFSIDVIWIKNNRVVGIEKNIPKMTSKIKIFSPGTLVDALIEVPAETIDKIDIAVNDLILIKKRKFL